MKTKLLALVLLAGSAAVAAPRVFAGVGFGASVYGPPVAAYGPMPVAPAAAYVPPMPGPIGLVHAGIAAVTTPDIGADNG